MKLSHTKIEKYLTCPMSYYLHYIEYLREDFIASPLFFGIAFDEAMNELLKTKMEGGPASCNPYKVFDDHFKTAVLNKEVISLKSSLKARYAQSDFNACLLEPEDLKELSEFIEANGYQEFDPLKLKSQIDTTIEAGGYECLDNTDRQFLNLIHYLSLRRKGHVMISAFIEDLLPKIKKVISIQEEVSLPNENGDILTGKIDFRALLEGVEGIVTCDNKSSSNKYAANSVLKSKQLSVYCEHTEDKHAAYFVVGKKPTKIVEKTCKSCGKIVEGGRAKTCQETINGERCNGEFEIVEYEKLITQLIVDTPSEETKQETFDEMVEVMQKIKNNDFPKKGLEENKCFSFGRKCGYYEYCRNGDMTNLLDLKENKDA